MKKQSLLCSVLCLLFLFVNRQVFSQENTSEITLYDVVTGYIKALEEKNIWGQTGNGEQVEPGVIIDDLNWLYLPPGIAIFLPVISEAENLIGVIGNQKHEAIFGWCVWYIWYDHEKNVIVFEDKGL
jgi:hypothetical protein